MSLGERDLVEAVERVTVRRLRRWVREGWIRPQENGDAPVFTEIDVARAQLLCELEEDLRIGREALPVVLSLLDQVHGLRRELRNLALAVETQPERVRSEIARVFKSLSED